jgi:Predicted transmembrane transcriptional regulator (anti-sigma factor)
MTCDEVLRSLSELIDGELPAAAREEVVRHLEGCPRCRRMRTDLEEVAHIVRAAPQPALPDGLEASVRALLRAQAGANRASVRKRLAVAVAPILSAATASVITAIVLTGSGGGGREPLDVVPDVLTAHVRSLLDEQPVRIVSSDPHTVRPWFGGRLDFAPATPDLGPQGFALVGGRVDYVGQRMVAALTYQRRHHVISVFAAPGIEAAFSLNGSSSIRQGYNLVSWRAAGLTYIAISDLNKEELDTFRQLFEASLQSR